jgi:hypothetical protein
LGAERGKGGENPPFLCLIFRINAERAGKITPTLPNLQKQCGKAGKTRSYFITGLDISLDSVEDLRLNKSEISQASVSFFK